MAKQGLFPNTCFAKSKQHMYLYHNSNNLATFLFQNFSEAKNNGYFSKNSWKKSGRIPNSTPNAFCLKFGKELFNVSPECVNENFIVVESNEKFCKVTDSYFPVFSFEQTIEKDHQVDNLSSDCSKNFKLTNFSSSLNSNKEGERNALNPFVPEGTKKKCISPRKSSGETHFQNQEKNEQKNDDHTKCENEVVNDLPNFILELNQDNKIEETPTLEDQCLLIRIIKDFQTFNGHLDEYQDVSSKYLDNAIGKHYKKVIDYLESKNVIEVNRDVVEGRGIKGGRCYGFKILREDKELNVKPSKKQLFKMNNLNNLTTPTDKWLVSRLNMIDIKYNENELKNITEESHKALVEKRGEWRNGEWHPYNNTTEGLYNIYNRQLDILKNGEINAKRDDFGKRFYSPITNLKSDCRQFLKVDGEPLVEIDLVASNLAMLAIVCLKKGVEGAKEFAMACENDIYMILSRETGESRDITKTALLAALCAPNYSRRQGSKTIVEFSKLFPGIMNYVFNVKKKQPKGIAKQMQLQETKIIIEGVCDSLRKKYPNMFVATVHDAFLVKECDVDLVLKTLYDITDQWLKINVKITNLKPKEKNYASN